MRSPNLTLELRNPVSLPEGDFELSSFEIEEVAPDPGDPDAHPTAGVNIKLDVPTSFVWLSVTADPDAPRAVAWTDRWRIELVGFDASGPRVDLAVDEISEEFIGETYGKLRFAKGAVVQLDDGVAMRFDAHSHKRTFKDHESPLIVHVTYDPAGEAVQKTHSLYPPEQVTWRWRDFLFRLEDSEYGEWVEVSYSRRTLVPLTAHTAP